MPTATNPLRYGLKFSQQVHPIDVQRDVWRIADQAGFDHVWGFDHLLSLGSDPAAPIFDGWTFLGAMAAITKRARIGLNVAREPPSSRAVVNQKAAREVAVLHGYLQVVGRDGPGARRKLADASRFEL